MIPLEKDAIIRRIPLDTSGPFTEDELVAEIVRRSRVDEPSSTAKTVAGYLVRLGLAGIVGYCLVAVLLLVAFRATGIAS